MSQKQLSSTNLLPTKDTLKALKSDVTFESAVLELCDNSIDAWRRTYNCSVPISIDIEVDVLNGSSELIVRDDAGGIPRERAAVVFGLGKTAGSNEESSIGAFGVGAKKSLVNLGLPFTIKSRDEEAGEGWEYRITEEWFEDDNDWSVSIDTTTDIEPGYTEIHIEDLNYEWSDETRASLITELEQAYNFFLSDEVQELRNTDYDLSLSVCGEPVTGEGLPDFSYSPFDGLHPRRYENIVIDIGDAPRTTLHVTVGLLKHKDSKVAGTDVYCQERKVMSYNRSPAVGFGTGTELIGRFSAHHERLRVLIELETKGDARQLPWDTQKSSIDQYNPIMRGTDANRGVYNWIRRLVSNYYELDADKVPEAFLRPYEGNSDFAINQGSPEILDYHSRSRITSSERPNADLDNIAFVKQLASAHSILGIWNESALEPWKVPAYRIQVDREADQGLHELEKLDDELPRKVLENPRDALVGIHQLANIHLNQGIIFDQELHSWEVPSYQRYLRDRTNGELSRIDLAPDDIPVRPEEIDQSDLQRVNGSQLVYSNESISEEKAVNSKAELYLILSDDDEDPNVAQLADVPRSHLCSALGVDSNCGDDVLWEALRELLNNRVLQNGNGSIKSSKPSQNLS